MAPDRDGDGHHAACDVRDALVRRPGQNLVAALGNGGKTRTQRVFHLIEGAAHRNLEGLHEDGVVLGHVQDVLDIHVADRLDIAGIVDDLRGPDPDLLHDALEAADLDDVTNLELVFEHDEDSGNDVGDEVLRPQ